MTVQEVKDAIARLSREEVAELEVWLSLEQESQARAWDEQIEGDIEDGKLDHPAAQVRADIAAGRTRPL